MTPSQIMHILKARWGIILFTLCLVVGLGAISLVMRPEQYTANAAVLLDVKSTDPIVGAGIQALAINSYMATQADIIRSERVISAALRKLEKDKDPALLASWEKEAGGRGELLPWLAERTVKHFEVLPSRESNVIRVSFTSPSPEDAAATANAIIDAYIATTIELRTEPAKLYNSFFDARAKELRLALETAQEALSVYQRKIGVVASDEKLDIENNRLSRLSSQLVTAENEAADSSSRKALSDSNAGSMPDVQKSPLITTLNAALADKQLQLKALTARYSKNHPTVATLRLDIDGLQTQIEAQTQKVLRGITLNDEAAQSRVAQLKAALETQRARLLRLKSQRDLAEILQRDVENAERAYSVAFEQTSQSNLESQANQTNVSVLKHASIPAKASSPRVKLTLVCAFVLGCLLAVASALACELWNRRLRSDDDVHLLLGQPLFGVLPKSTFRKRQHRVHRPRSRGVTPGPAVLHNA